MIQCSQVGVFIAFNMSVLSQLCQRIYTPPHRNYMCRPRNCSIIYTEKQRAKHS